jgi:iron complex transport system substrate-binding protein
MMRLFLVLLSALSLSAADLPRSIVSLSPNLTEILYGVGAFDRVVGVSDYCTYPAAVKKLPDVGGWRNPNLERIPAFQPDLVLIDDGQAAFIRDNRKALGLPVVVVSDDSVDDVFTAIATLGRATGCEAQAGRLAASTRAALARISQTTAALPKPAVVLIVDRFPGTLRGLIAATGDSFLGELVALAGGRIDAPLLHGAYGHVNKEDLLSLDPDAILDFVHGRAGPDLSPIKQTSAWQELPELKPVRQRRVYPVNEDYVPHASQRMVQTAELFARLIHNRRSL